MSKNACEKKLQNFLFPNTYFYGVFHFFLLEVESVIY